MSGVMRFGVEDIGWGTGIPEFWGARGVWNLGDTGASVVVSGYDRVLDLYVLNLEHLKPSTTNHSRTWMPLRHYHQTASVSILSHQFSSSIQSISVVFDQPRCVSQFFERTAMSPKHMCLFALNHGFHPKILVFAGKCWHRTREERQELIDVFSYAVLDLQIANIDTRPFIRLALTVSYPSGVMR